MTVWILLLFAVNIGLGLGMWLLWNQFKRPPKDDPRLSRGLQLLQSKISVLEDLSDKTETQFSQLSSLLEKKCREVQKKIEQAEVTLAQIESSVEKSLEVAKIFEDKIPHSEIVDRKKTRAYVKAAKMAHRGASISDIAKEIDLPVGELEIIAKVNKDRLMFSADSLPEWVEDNFDSDEDFDGSDDLSKVLMPSIEAPSSLKELGERFRQACADAEIDEATLISEDKANIESEIGSESEIDRGTARSISASVKNFIDNSLIGEKIANLGDSLGFNQNEVRNDLEALDASLKDHKKLSLQSSEEEKLPNVESMTDQVFKELSASSTTRLGSEVSLENEPKNISQDRSQMESKGAIASVFDKEERDRELSFVESEKEHEQASFENSVVVTNESVESSLSTEIEIDLDELRGGDTIEDEIKTGEAREENSGTAVFGGLDELRPSKFNTINKSSSEQVDKPFSAKSTHRIVSSDKIKKVTFPEIDR